MTTTTMQTADRLWTANFVRLSISNFMLFFSFYLLMPLLPIYLSETYGAGKHAIGIILSGYTVMALASRPFAGFVVDSFSRKKVLVLVYALFFLLFAGYLIEGSLLLFAIVRTIHGAPFGMVTVSNSTCAIDALLPSRRSEGIGYYGLSNNLAMATAPSAAIYIYHLSGSFSLLFLLSLFVAGVGLSVCMRVNGLKRVERDVAPVEERPCRWALSFDRFFLTDAVPEAAVLCALSFSFGVLSTYLAIYSKQELGLTDASGTYFLLLAVGLICSRLVGGRSLRKGRAMQNARMGMTLSLFGYLLFALGHSSAAYYGSALIIGLGNGHMFPGMQTMFINLAPHTRRGTANATQLTAWDAGLGLGVVIGGFAAENLGYQAAFIVAAAVNALGVLFFWTYGCRHYTRCRLR